MLVYGKILVIYDRNRFECGTALGAWKTRWAVLSRWCLGIVVDTRIADLSFIRFEQ